MSSTAILLLNLAMAPHFAWLLATTLAAYLAHRFRRRVPEAGPPVTRFLIVVPAHDEERGISATVRSCLDLDYARNLFEVLVLADNCRDATADVARQSGATVMVRGNPDRRSKGFALEDLFEQLEQSGRLSLFDATVIIDADTTVDPRLLRAFARRVESGADWIQAFDTVGNRDDSWRTQLMAYAFYLINGTILLGQETLGLGAGLRGNGMCLSTRGLRRVPWSSHGLAEDEEFSWSLRLAGETIVFEPEAVVSATMLRDGGVAAANQRRRWEFGRREARNKTLIPLIGSRNLGWFRKLCAVVELTLPSTLGILLLYGAILFGNVLMLNSGLIDNPIVRAALWGSSALMTGSLLLYALSPFLVFRLPWRYGMSLIHVPTYAAWKIAVMLQGRPREWVRADRRPAGAPSVSVSVAPGVRLLSRQPKANGR